MVQAEISQQSGECNAWRETLRQLREEFTQDKSKLQQAAGRSLSHEQLQEVEHLHNQFHIQLINIHDLKQAIKNHDRKMSIEMEANNGQLQEETLAEHAGLFDEYQRLTGTLQTLRKEFDNFFGRSQ